MNFEIRRSFSRDIEKINDVKLLQAVYDTIENIGLAKTIKEIRNISRLQGSKKHYRIRIGNYRMGLYIENKIVYIVRILNRKEIYRYFP